MTPQPNTLSREELYRLVWAEPVARVAERYGISGAGLRKLCLRQGIPVPPRGHWARVAAGQKTKRSPLPPEPKRRSTGPALGRRTPAPNPAQPEIPEVGERAAYEAEPRHRIRINRRITSSSDWALALREAATKAHRDQRGLLKIPLEQHCVSATIAKTSVARLAHILAALERACHARGLLQDTRRAGQPTRLMVEGVPLHLHVTERTTRHEVPAELRQSRSDAWRGDRSVFRYDPTGTLTLAVTTSGDAGGWAYLPASQLIRDTASQPLEERLNAAIVAMVARSAKERHLQVQRREEAERQRVAEEAARAAALARQRRQLETQALEDLAMRRERSERIRALIDAVATSGRAPESSGTPSELFAWLAWAQAIADELDPLTG